MHTDWYGKPYYSLDAYCKNTYGEKYYKIALDGGFSCPNRDGRAGRGGCIFCSAGGSGDFAVNVEPCSISEQLETGRRLFGSKKTGTRFIAYFQAYTGTYAPIDYLQNIYTEALEQPEIGGISIATRPDCLPDEVLTLLTKLKSDYPNKFIWIELGLQTIHEETAAFCNRGYKLPVFKEAMEKLSSLAIKTVVHVILGLPGETPQMMYETCRYLNSTPAFGIKLQLLHVLKGTALGESYLSGALPDFKVLSQEEYTDIVIHCLEILRPNMVIHRLTGDGPKNTTIAPLWSLNKRNVLNTLHSTMKQRDTYQGRSYHDAGCAYTI
ncbi:MAG: TIGR01212 family radical SAM protein [Lachnospiraceae bacterium]|nr:TIGR01212 family radical SAM protein [Lachnospiraceae bacterium]